MSETILDGLQWKVEFESGSHRAEIMLSRGNTRFGWKHGGSFKPRGGWFRMRCYCEGMTLEACQNPARVYMQGRENEQS